MQISEKTLENVRRHRDKKLVATKIRKKFLMLEPNYHATKFFTENLLAIEIQKTEILMSKLVYLGLSIIELSKILILFFEFYFWI